MADNSPLSQTKDAHMRPQLPSNLLFLPSARQDAPTKATDPADLHPHASEQGATFLMEAEAELEDREAKALGEPHAPARPEDSQMLLQVPTSFPDTTGARCEAMYLADFLALPSAWQDSSTRVCREKRLLAEFSHLTNLKSPTKTNGGNSSKSPSDELCQEGQEEATNLADFLLHNTRARPPPWTTSGSPG